MLYGCLCGGCRDCLRAQGHDPDAEEVDKLEGEVLAEWLRNPSYVAAAWTEFSAADCAAIESAHAAQDATALLVAVNAAACRALSEAAREVAHERLIDEAPT